MKLSTPWYAIHIRLNRKVSIARARGFIRIRSQINSKPRRKNNQIPGISKLKNKTTYSQTLKAKIYKNHVQQATNKFRNIQPSPSHSRKKSVPFLCTTSKRKRVYHLHAAVCTTQLTVTDLHSFQLLQGRSHNQQQHPQHKNMKSNKQCKKKHLLELQIDPSQLVLLGP